VVRRHERAVRHRSDAFERGRVGGRPAGAWLLSGSAIIGKPGFCPLSTVHPPCSEMGGELISRSI
jgi:hypothetical protein